MPVSIPINNLITLSATRVTGKETIPAVQYEGGAAYTYQVAMSSMFYTNCIGTNQIQNGSITLNKLSEGFPTWSTDGTLSLSGDLQIGNRTSSPLYLSLGYDRAVAGNTSIFMYSDVGIIPDTSIVRSSGTNGKLTISNTGTGGTDIVNTMGAPLSLKTNDTTRLFIADSGDIGIGTNSSTPNAKLNVTYSSSNDAVRITQTGAGNALVVEDNTNPDSSPFIVTANGTLLIGDTISRTITDVTTSRVQINSENQVGNSAGISCVAWDSDSGDILHGPIVSMSRSLAGTTGTHAAVTQNDSLGAICFNGSDGTQFIKAAQITSSADGNASTGNMPGRLVFLTSPTGTSTPVERMRITSSGNIGIGTDTPSTKLEVTGGIKCTSIQSSGDADFGQNTRTGTGVITGDVNLQVGYNRTGNGISKILLYGSAGSSATGFTTIQKESGINGNLNISDNGTGSLYLTKNNAAGTIRFQTGAGGNDRITILANGNVGIGTVAPGTLLEVNGAVKALSFNTSSSLRYKKNIIPLENALDIVSKLNAVRFTWKNSNKTEVGLIAEEVDSILPEVVLKNEKNQPEAIDYSKLTSILISAIQELQNKLLNLNN